jgi:enterochelin esterase-like enzyme
MSAQEPDLIKQCVIPATVEHGAIRFGVMLPPSYENHHGPYPVLYYMHGMNHYYLSPRAHWIASFFHKQFAEEQLPEFIMVFIDGGEGYWMDHFDGDPMLETEIVNCLIPDMDKNYRINPSLRLTMGYSLGGIGAVYFYAKHPELFAGAISLDGGILTYEDYLYRTGGRPEIISNEEYFYEYGSPYEWVKRNRDSLVEKQDTSLFLSAALLKEANKEFLSILQEQGIPAKYIEVDCAHEFECVFSESQEELLRFKAKKLKPAQGKKQDKY